MFVSSRIADSFEASFFSVNAMQEFKSEDYVFLLVQRGAFIVSEGSSKYVLSENDLILLMPNVLYTFQYQSQNQIFSFRIKHTFFDTHVPAGYTIHCNSSESNREEYLPLIQKLQDIGILYSDEDRRYAFISELYALLDLLILRFSVSQQYDQDTEFSSPTDLRVQKIQQYINQHYHLPIFLQTLADEMFLSPQYLSKFIKQHMGITFNKYLNNVRLMHAFEELTYTDHSITEIAFNNGFSNTSAFNKQFRDTYQLSPTQYRKDHGITESAEEKILPEQFETRRESASVELAHLDISCTNGSAFYPTWSDTINIGMLSNALTDSFHRAFSRAQAELGFRYVRFNNIFDDIVISYIPGLDTYNFSNLDMIFDYFREENVIPFIEICYKPPKISLTTQLIESDEDLFANEKDLPYLLKALQATLEHFIYRYGKDEVSKWRFEVWAKHDDLLNYLETPAEYWDKYQAYAAVIHRLLPAAAIGGPGYNTSNTIEVFKLLLNEMRNRQICPDFFSIYMYCYSPAEYLLTGENPRSRTIKRLSSNPDYPLHTFNLYRDEILKAAPASVPLYLTEFNSGLNGYNHVSGSSFQAAFIVKTMLALLQKTSCVAYWHFADFSSEIFLGPQTYATGMGLIEQHGIPKPGFFSYVFFSKLKSRLLALGKQYIATTNGRNKFQFMICNYVHYNNNYCFTYQNRLGIGNTYTVFEDAECKRVTINLTDLPIGRYKCMIYTVNRQHGSILDKFIDILDIGKTSPAELDYMLMNMQDEEISYYQKAAIPNIQFYYTDTTDGVLSFTLDMEPHEVDLITLERRI